MPGSAAISAPSAAGVTWPCRKGSVQRCLGRLARQLERGRDGNFSGSCGKVHWRHGLFACTSGAGAAGAGVVGTGDCDSVVVGPSGTPPPSPAPCRENVRGMT
jgi:hypothetical protein